ncbi:MULTISPECIES: PilZ domain-containing protein [Pseudoalteromonas]|uniref:Pilus assembly protein PilZ n=1 Tax=Pseudoalteromonas ruthenica TaxID=151081 RepID=A0A0F4PWZ5_9GAMM|nr:MULTISPECIES: PilZ domain-containing protein [Pseudoalteromonas]MCG7542856.1 PilZ domain-containing protein [Pseudoalteromonas sp. MM17-2]MCG7557588.1 PilZ domain-containing protein [Pseudoalteromonas sp. CNAT2-18.1]MCG7565184.1 PilZ domain-containing protein [Pseudoalteromonas sp. CnMc7-15]MCG7568509.1 PilZ domain-containing protein [Pseudoalteromonas sp. CNC9-20]KJY99629.1 pilus assembly protein PilZ [Pseudoalteromonas ruthenica]
MQELLVELDDLDELYRCYMPYIKSGGLFVRTNMNYEMGQSLALRVTLPDSLEDDVVTGKVVWVTPIGAQSSNPPGIGIGFIDDKTHVRDKIEKMLGTMLNSGNPTYTM